MRPYSISLFAVLSVVLTSSPQALGQTQASCQFTIVKPPQSVTDVVLNGINDYGNAVGYVDDVNGGGEWGFIRYADGTWNKFQAGQYPSGVGFTTWFAGRNNSGVTVGGYQGADRTTHPTHGLVLYGSTPQTVDYPGSFATELTGINKYGTMIGHYQVNDGHFRGFQLKNGTFTLIKFPGAYETYPNSISDTGVIVGYYHFSSGGNLHGFTLQNGVYKSLDYPNAFYTSLTGNNTVGMMAGNYVKSKTASFPSSFIYKNGVFQTLVFPGHSYTIVSGINNKNQVAGRVYDTAGGRNYGFVATCQ